MSYKNLADAMCSKCRAYPCLCDKFIPKEEERWKLLAWAIAWEGSICLHKGRNSENRNLVWYCPSVNLNNTDSNLLSQFVQLANCGNVSFFGRRNPRHKNQYRWALTSMGAVKSFLLNILPYLPTKRKQAELVIEFCTLRLNNHKHGLKGMKGLHTREPREEEIFQELRELNKKGKASG